MKKTIDSRTLLSKQYIPFFLLLAGMFLCSSCSLPKRGVVDDNRYISNQSPKIEISVGTDFSYIKGEAGEYRHQFHNRADHKFVFLHHIAPPSNQSTIDYFYHPEKWIYNTSEDHVILNRHSQKMVGETWYVQDYVSHPSTAQCYLARQFSTFTLMYDVFHIFYGWEIPPYKCADWSDASNLSEEQENYLEEFRQSFSSDVSIKAFTEG